MSKLIKKTFANNGGIIGAGSAAAIAGLLTTAADTLTVDVSELTEITVTAIQVADAGTATLLIEASNDGGASWSPVTNGTLSEASFGAANNVGTMIGISDARGMALAIQMLRARLSAVSGGGTYRMNVAGRLLSEFRSR